MRKERAGIFPSSRILVIGVSVEVVTHMMMVTTTPVIASVSKMHIVHRVQFLRQIIQLERMVGNLLLDSLLTRTGKTNAEARVRSYPRSAQPRRMKDALRFAATGIIIGSITLKKGIIGDVIIVGLNGLGILLAHTSRHLAPSPSISHEDWTSSRNLSR